MKKIWVGQSPALAQAMSFVRGFMNTIGTALASKGVFDGDYGEIGGGLAVLVAAYVWGQFSARRKHHKMLVMAEHSPSPIADVKR